MSTHDALEVMKKNLLDSGLETSSFSVFQVIQLKVPPQASHVLIACLHNRFLILLLKVKQFPEQICNCTAFTAEAMKCVIYFEGHFHLYKCRFGTSAAEKT